MSQTHAVDPRPFAAHARGHAPVTSLRTALREDVREGRKWVGTRAFDAREAVQDHPIRAAAYAAGIGVMVGLLLRR